MNDTYLKKAFDTIDEPNDRMLELVRAGMRDKAMTRRVPKRRVAIVACLAVLAVGFVGYQIPGVASVAADTIGPWISMLTGKTLTTGTDSTYIELNNTDRSRTEAKYTTIDEIEELLGVDILQSDMAYEGTEGLITYRPVIVEGKLFSADIDDEQYALGDLKNVKIESDPDDISSVADSVFDKGALYSSTMRMAVAVLGNDADPEAVLANLETDDPIDQGAPMTTHKLLQVDATAEIQTRMTDDSPGMDSPTTSFGKDGTLPMTVAWFLYNGQSYSFMARVSEDTMKSFLDTLSAEPGVYKVSKPSGEIVIDHSDSGASQIPLMNEKGEFVLEGGEGYSVGTGDLAPGRYDIEATGEVREGEEYYTAAPGQKALGEWYWETNGIDVPEGSAWILKPAAMAPLEKVGDTYTLRNTVGQFEVGVQIEAGVYEVTLEVEGENVKSSGDDSPGLLIQPWAKDGENYDSIGKDFDNSISEQFDEAMGYGPKKLELIEGTFIGISNFNLQSDFTVTFKKLS